TTSTTPTKNRNPTLSGTSVTGYAIKIYADSACASAIQGTGIALAGAFSIPVSNAAADGTTTYFPTATSGANVSSCSTSLRYHRAAAAPAAPPISSSNPATSRGTPSSDTTPELTGVAEAGSSVTIHNNAACSGSPVGSGTASGGGAFTITATA